MKIDKSDEIRLQVMLERAVKNHAIYILNRWNKERESTDEWPHGQSWDELATSSQSTLFRHSCEELDIEYDLFKEIRYANSMKEAYSDL